MSYTVFVFISRLSLYQDHKVTYYELLYNVIIYKSYEPTGEACDPGMGCELLSEDAGLRFSDW